MTTFLFPDNTVLCNFAAVDRLDLLQVVLNGRGRWTAAVAFEASRSARHHPALAGVPAAGWLDEPIEITAESDVQRVNRVRRAVFGGTDDKPLQHLGEAETCVVIKSGRRSTVRGGSRTIARRCGTPDSRASPPTRRSTS